jgi:hypothetical protein
MSIVGLRVGSNRTLLLGLGFFMITAATRGRATGTGDRCKTKRLKIGR